MYGAIIGDLAGSIYEYFQIEKVSPVLMKNIIEENSFISDDTILTIAVLDAVLSDQNYDKKIREYIGLYKDFLPNFKPYFKTVFSPNMIKWSSQNFQGNSKGNGAMMRISPIGFMFDNEEDLKNNVKAATICSHNSDEALKCAEIVALVIYYARKGYTNDQIINKLNIKLKNKEITKFNYTCSDTIDICLWTVFNSNSFEDSIRKTLLYGGDTDTNCCIVGSMAEALYGIDQSLIDKANNYLPVEFKTKLDKAYTKIKEKNKNAR